MNDSQARQRHRLISHPSLFFVLLALMVQMALPPQWVAAQVEAPQRGAGTVPQDEPIRLNFKDASLDEVLDYLSERAGLIVVKTIKLDGRVTVISRQPMPVSDAISVVNTALKERGYAAILLGRTLKIVEFDDASKESIPVRTGNDPNAIPQTDEMITHVLTLRHADAEKLAEDLQPLLPNYAILAANVRSNTLILTDTSSNVRRIAQIVQALDYNIANAAVVRVFPLTYADAVETARLVNDLFGEGQTSSRNRSDPRREFFLRALRRRGRGGSGEGDTQDSSTQPSIKLAAAGDERTNTLVVTGPPDTLEVIAQVIDELDDNPESNQDVLIYHVKNGTAEHLAETLNDLFEEEDTRSRNVGNQNRDFRGRDNRGRNNRGQNESGSESTPTDLVGQVHVVAETDTNSLLVMTTSKNFARVRRIIEELDHTVPQVLIKVLIAEVTHDRSTEIGVEWSILKDNNDYDLFTDFDLADSVTGGLTIATMKSEIDATLNALEEIGKLDVLSRPYILAHENQEASITVGQVVPFITNSFQTDTGGLRNTVNYEDIGIILTVTPHINPDGLVVMDVAPEISTISDSTVPISENFNAVVFNKRAAFARVAIMDGQTIIIGGLMQDQLNDTVKKVPLLGDIPLLGELFKSTQTKKTKTELLIFLTPHVAKDPDDLKKISDYENRGTKIVPDAVEEGMFEDHMQSLERDSR